MENLNSDIINNFYNRITKTETFWIWNGAKLKSGYGQLRVNGRHILAHRLSWIIENSKDPDSLILHTCDNRICVNPKHLYDGTSKQNTIDSVDRNRHYEASKTHCQYGHEFSLENTYLYKNNRKCKKCTNRRALEHYHKRKNK